MRLYADFRKKLGNMILDVKMDTNCQRIGFLGPSGSGKSMALKCISGIEIPDEGRIMIGNEVLYDSYDGICLKPQQRKIGYLFQNYALFPNMNVEKNIKIAIRNETEKEKEAIFRSSVKRFALEGMEDKYPRQLSGGQQQRVALARIIASKPHLLLLDEPLSALDEELRANIEKEIDEVMSQGIGTIFVSHDKKEVFRLCDEIAFVKNGKIFGTENKQDLVGKMVTSDKLKIIEQKEVNEEMTVLIELTVDDNLTRTLYELITK
ncbi:MAG: ATP-binding cassette domain-containing protein [Proteocatella sp.]